MTQETELPALPEPVAWLARYIDKFGRPAVYVTTNHELAVETNEFGDPQPLQLADQMRADSLPPTVDEPPAQADQEGAKKAARKDRMIDDLVQRLRYMAEDEAPTDMTASETARQAYAELERLRAQLAERDRDAERWRYVR